MIDTKKTQIITAIEIVVGEIFAFSRLHFVVHSYPQLGEIVLFRFVFGLLFIVAFKLIGYEVAFTK